jgi:hypothetical protein
MNPTQATQVIEDVLKQIQTNSGLACPALNDGTKPLKDLAKFDSPTSLAATGMVARRLGIKIDPKINIFGDKNGLNTIKQTVALICTLATPVQKEPAKA